MFISVPSLRVFPSSARVQRRLCSVLPLLLTCGVPAKWPSRKLSGFHKWPLFRKSTTVHQTCPVHTGLCITEGSLVIFALRFCPTTACLQASNTSPPPFQTRDAVSSAWAASVNLCWKVFIWFGRKHVISIRPVCLCSAEPLTCSPWQALALHTALLHAGWTWQNCGVFIFGF